ncbi:hypothetical protein SDC9_192895 [bioreactor metagenome]|uniref:Uncharacterized protein n=1 Tax=bioreactor metagenome TaxID=1076179 RepID=A0A645I265_9ZZZZ
MFRKSLAGIQNHMVDVDIFVIYYSFDGFFICDSKALFAFQHHITSLFFDYCTVCTNDYYSPGYDFSAFLQCFLYGV